MLVLGLESSCDECSVALVENGRKIVGHVIASQVEIHKEFEGVVPELASRKHLESFVPVYRETLRQAGIDASSVDGIAVTNRPGLTGSLQVGLSFAKGLALALGKPFVGVDHILGHLYAVQLEAEVEYPFLGLLVSGGHSVICRVDSFDGVRVLGASIDDAVGEAFDKTAKHYGLGYPGGKILDDLARRGNPKAFRFPFSRLYKGAHTYDVSYSGLKNAVINQLDLFWDGVSEKSMENIAASFERVAVETIVRPLVKAAADQGLVRVVAGGGVAANTYLRRRLAEEKGLTCYFPSLELCGDNAAMIAGLGYHFLNRGDRSTMREKVFARVEGFRKI